MQSFCHASTLAALCLFSDIRVSAAAQCGNQFGGCEAAGAEVETGGHNLLTTRAIPRTVATGDPNLHEDPQTHTKLKIPKVSEEHKQKLMYGRREAGSNLLGKGNSLQGTSKSYLDLNMRWTPAAGQGGNLPATSGVPECSEDSYNPSELETGFSQNANQWTETPSALCSHVQEWVTENLAGEREAGPKFSRLCKQGQPMQVIEPLAGILRDPRMFCPDYGAEFSIDWLVLADSGSAPMDPASKRYLFDAGGTRFMDAMNFFTSKYEERGIVFDHVYVWEAAAQGTEAYWADVPPETRAFWEPRLTFYDGVPITADPDDEENNPVNRIHQLCTDKDFCAFKLDIDTPAVEFPVVQQLINQPDATKASLDEFFFEHHVHGLMQAVGWGDAVEGTFADSYKLFTQLRRLGVRAHSWI